MAEETEADDEELVRQTVSGETNLFRVLIERHQRSILFLFARQIGEGEVAEELTQKCFFQAFKDLHNFPYDTTFKTWITRTALNVMNSYYASPAYKRKLKEIHLTTERHDRVSKIYDTSIEQKQSTLQLAIGQLGERHRRVISICLLENYSPEEASDILAVPAKTLASRTQKALALLHEEYLKLIEYGAQ